MSIVYFTETENDWKRRPEVEMITGIGKFRVLEYQKELPDGLRRNSVLVRFSSATKPVWPTLTLALSRYNQRSAESAGCRPPPEHFRVNLLSSAYIHTYIHT